MTARPRTVLVCEIDQVELACRIFEAMNDMARPAGVTAQQGMATVQKADPEVYRRLMNASARAIKYLGECAGNGVRPS